MILEDGKPRGGLQLLVVEGKKVCLGLLDLVEHVLPEFLSRLDLLAFLLVHFIDPLFLLVVKPILELFQLISQIHLNRLEVLDVLVLLRKILILIL